MIEFLRQVENGVISIASKLRLDAAASPWYDRKAAKTNPIIATKALACKLAKAAWHVMTAGVDYDAQRVFGPPPAAPLKT